MMDVLQFYVSSFWIWAGITFGLAVVLKYLVELIVGAVSAWRKVNFKA